MYQRRRKLLEEKLALAAAGTSLITASTQQGKAVSDSDRDVAKDPNEIMAKLYGAFSRAEMPSSYSWGSLFPGKIALSTHKAGDHKVATNSNQSFVPGASQDLVETLMQSTAENSVIEVDTRKAYYGSARQVFAIPYL
jgi:hypothetical protein